MSTGLTSTSLDRAPGPSNSFVRGKTGFVPFWPGGLDDARADTAAIDDLHEEAKGLRKVAPGLSRGLRLPGDDADEDGIDDLEFAPEGNRGAASQEVRLLCPMSALRCLR